MATVTVNSAEVGALLRATDGPVVRSLMVLGEKVRVRTIATLRSGFPREFIGPRIVVQPTKGADGVLGARVGAARLKTRPHPIEGNPVLVFFWERAGEVVFFRHVNHPGSDMSRYTQERLEAALLATRGSL